MCLLLAVAATYAYPPSYGHFLKRQEKQSRLGGEVRGEGRGEGRAEGRAEGRSEARSEGEEFGKKNADAVSAQHAIEEVSYLRK